jgi:hypothetical protein
MRKQQRKFPTQRKNPHHVPQQQQKNNPSNPRNHPEQTPHKTPTLEKSQVRLTKGEIHIAKTHTCKNPSIIHSSRQLPRLSSRS